MTLSNLQPDNQNEKGLSRLTDLQEIWLKLSPTNQEICKAVHLSPKLRDDPNPKFNIAYSIQTIQQLLGVKQENELPKESRTQLVEFIYESYPYLTSQEFIVAIKLNLKGDLAPVKLPNGQTADRIECFGRVDVQYLTSVILEYQKSKQRAILAEKAAIEKMKDSMPKTKATPEESWNYILKEFKENGTPPKSSDWSGAFNYLWRSGKAKEFCDVSEFGEKAKKVIMDELTNRLKKASNLFERAEIEIDMQENMINMEIRKRFIIKYLYDNKDNL